MTSNEPRYPFLVVDVPADTADELSAALFELGASGVEERDDQTLLRGAGGGRVTLRASFSDRAEAEAAIEGLREVEVSADEVVLVTLGGEGTPLAGGRFNRCGLGGISRAPAKTRPTPRVPGANMFSTARASSVPRYSARPSA